MAVGRFFFDLEDQVNVYYSGDKIKGALNIHLNSPITIAGVEICFKGSARVTWYESMHNGTRRTDIEHDKEEIYFDDRFCLWGKVNSKGEWESTELFEKGTHMLPFQYRLPNSLPCSFESLDGYVRYSIQGKLISEDLDNVTSEKLFTVLTEFDPKVDTSQGQDMNTAILPPVEDYAERLMGNKCCRTGRVSCALSLRKRAFVPGEKIRASIVIQNFSVQKSGACYVLLKQIVTCGQAIPHDAILVSSKLCDSLRPGQSRHWRGFEILVPPTCPSRLDMCKIIDLKYCIAVDTSFPDYDLYAAVPITIATIPEAGLELARWCYKASGSLDRSEHAQDVSESPSHQPTFAPKYKFFEEIRGRRKEAGLITRLAQSPGVRKRRKSKVSEPREGAKLLDDGTLAAGDADT